MTMSNIEFKKTDQLPIFSMANSFSGHTLLALLLNAHKQIVHLGDTISSKQRYKERVPCTCGKKIADCYFWQRVFLWERFEYLRSGFPKSAIQKIIFQNPLFFPLQKLLVLSNKEYIQYNNVLFSFLKYVSDMTGKEQLIFGRKRICDPALVMAGGTKIKIIHLSKHPIEFAGSYKKRYPKQSIDTVAKVWLRYNRNVNLFRLFYNSNSYLHIPFSELCQSSERSLRRICEFIGLAFDPNMIDPIVPSEYHLIGSNSIVKSQLIRINSNRSSANLLTQDEKKNIWEITKKVAEKLGYSYV